MTTAASAIWREPIEPIGSMAAAGNAARGFFASVMSGPKRLWTWLRSALHLDAVASATKSIWHKIAGWAISFKNFMGFPGMLGMGLLTVSTDSGRKMLDFLLGKPLRFLGRMFGKGWGAVETFFEAHLGTPGTWISNRMADVEEFFIGNGSTTTGVVGWVVGFYFDHIASYLNTHHWLMKIATVLGTYLVGYKAIGALALIPMGGFMLGLLQWLAGAVLGIWIFILLMDAFFGEESLPVVVVVATDKADADAAAHATTKESVPNLKTTPINRAEKRHAQAGRPIKR